MTKTIACADCGHEHTVKRSNAKYCAVCRLFRNLIYLGARTRKCVSCENRYAPLHVNDQLCANCDFSGQAHPHTDCALCEQQDMPAVREGVRICLYCAKDIKRRDTVTRALGKKRRARQQEQGVGA